MVRTALATRRGVDDTRSIRDMGASTKRKENQSSSNSGRKRKTSIPWRLQGPGGRVYTITPETEPVDQSVIQGMFMLSCLWAKILFDSSASPSFVAASSVDVLGLEVETLDESLHVSSPLWTRVRIDQICRDCELEISGILLTVDLRVMDISEFYVILGMDWLTAHRSSLIVIVGGLLPTHGTVFV